MYPIRLILILLICLTALPTLKADTLDSLSKQGWTVIKNDFEKELRQIASNLKSLILQNRENDRKGLSHLNRYVLTDGFDSLAISDEDYLRKLGDMKAYSGEMENILAKTKEINGVKANFYVFLEGAAGIDESLVSKFGDSGILFEQIENAKDMEELFTILGQTEENLKKILKNTFDKDFNISTSEGYRRFKGVFIKKIIQLVQQETSIQINCYFQGAFYYLDKLKEELKFGQFHYNLINSISYSCLISAKVGENLDMILKILDGADCGDLVGKTDDAISFEMEEDYPTLYRVCSFLGIEISESNYGLIASASNKKQEDLYVTKGSSLRIPIKIPKQIIPVSNVNLKQDQDLFDLLVAFGNAPTDRHVNIISQLTGKLIEMTSKSGTVVVPSKWIGKSGEEIKLGGYTLKLEDMKIIFPNTPPERLKTVTETINKYGQEYGIATKTAIAHLVAQMGFETGEFKAKVEILGYSVGRLKEKFSKFFGKADDPKTKDINEESKGPYDPNEYAGKVNAEKMLNLVYDDNSRLKVGYIKEELLGNNVYEMVFFTEEGEGFNLQEGIIIRSLRRIIKKKQKTMG